MMEAAQEDERFRATCQRCGSADGHLQHAPPPSPTSGVWCAPCYATLLLHVRLLKAALVAVPVAVGLGVWWMGRS